jgi:tRNA (guanine37-N1)-methyltransferase
MHLVEDSRFSIQIKDLEKIGATFPNMRIDIITIFPKLFNDFLAESLLARAQKPRRLKGSGSRSKVSGKPLLEIKSHDLRRWTKDKHKTVDDRPYGGGAGMVLKIEPIYRAVKSLKLSVDRKSKLKTRSKVKGQRSKVRTVLLSAKGKTFTQRDAKRLSKYDQLIFICGRYEGVDERVAKYVADEEISIGNYVLFGGEVPAMVITEAVSRLIPGVIAKEDSVKFESFADKDAKTKEYPHYTRPEIFNPGRQATRLLARQASDKRQVKNWKVPRILLSGDHKKIKEWRKKHSIE